jgi:YD repeat-containing protein
MALTDTALKALKPRGKPYTVTDGRGLYVEVFPTGGIVWRYRYRLNGKRSAWTFAEGREHCA